MDPVDGVIWSAAPPALPYSLHLFRFTSKKREREGLCLVRSPSSIEYRYSPSPSPSSVFLLFFFEKLCRIVFCCSYALRHHHICPHFFPFLFIIFPSLPLAFPLDSLIAPRKETPRPLVVPYPYRTVSYYITNVSFSPPNRLTNQPSLRNFDGRYSTVYIFEQSESGT
jgi:hypothetical protein